MIKQIIKIRSFSNIVLFFIGKTKISEISIGILKKKFSYPKSSDLDLLIEVRSDLLRSDNIL